MRRVVISGIGVVSPLGLGVGTFWDRLLSGECAIERISQFDPSGFPSQIAGQAPAYKINDFVPKAYRKASKVMARDIELAVIAADDAFKDSGLQSKAYSDSPSIDSARFGCNIGAGLISTELNELVSALQVSRDADQPDVLDMKKWGAEGINHLTPLWLLKYLPNMLACHVTIIHGLKGPSNTITCGDASSHLAIGEAYRTIQRGDADLAICGGAESKINPMGLVRQTLLKRLNQQCNDAPHEAVRPFDQGAAGTAVAEGGGLFILEEMEHAQRRGAKIYAEIVGFGATQDSYSITEPDPRGSSYAKAVQKAMRQAAVSAGQVDLLVPHGLGIASHDRAELRGLRQALGEDLSQIPISAAKAQIGSLAAGCGVDAAVAALAVKHGRIPPAINTHSVLDGQKLNVSPAARDATIHVAISSVYSVGGQNAALVLRRCS